MVLHQLSKGRSVNTEDQIPTTDDWDDCPNSDDLDRRWAYKRFFGKNRDEALLFFRDPILETVEDLRNMPRIPFQYYFQTYKRFILLPETLTTFANDSVLSSGASCFLNMMIDKLKESPDWIIPLMGELMPAAEFVASHQMEYDAEPEFFGSFPDKLDEIKLLYQQSLDELERC